MQSKLSAILLAAVILIAMVHFMPRPLYRQIDLEGVTCQVFCRQTTAEHTNVGFGKIINCNGADIVQTLTKCKGVDGVSIRFEGDENQLQSILQQLSVTVHTTQELDSLTVFCGYSPKISGCINLDGNKTNLQIAFDGKTITVGSPLILGDY